MRLIEKLGIQYVREGTVAVRRTLAAKMERRSRQAKGELMMFFQGQAW
jgi:hypothetical protein